jgi:hypothetical protein
VRVWTRRWGALQLFHPHLLTLNARTQRLEGRPPEHRPQRAARRRGPSRWATPRRGRGQGALGCGRLGLTRTSTCRKASSARRPVHHRSIRATAAARPDTARRGWGPCTPDSPALSRAPATAGRRGPALALGCAVSATAFSLSRKPNRRHGQDTGLEARRALGAEHDGAARGSPRSLQQQTRHEGTRSLTADAACLGWTRRGGASRASRVAAHSWRNGDATDVRRHEGTHTGRLREGTVQGEGGGHGAHSGSAV